MSGSTVRHRAGNQRMPHQHNIPEASIPLAVRYSSCPTWVKDPPKKPRLCIEVGPVLHTRYWYRRFYVARASPSRTPYEDVAGLSQRVQDNDFVPGTVTTAFVPIESP
jgi:hypothetical protein